MGFVSLTVSSTGKSTVKYVIDLPITTLYVVVNFNAVMDLNVLH